MRMGLHPGGAFRSLWRSEKQAYLAHLKRLDRTCRRLRFHRAMSDAALEAHAEAVFANPGARVIGWFRQGVLRGAAEVAVFAAPSGVNADLEPEEDREAEAAFAVETPYRRLGVGRELMHRATLFARNQQAKTLRIATERDNRPMVRLAMGSGVVFTIDDGEAEGILSPEPRTVFSLALELAEEEVGRAHWLWEQGWRWMRAGLRPNAAARP